MSEGGSSAPGSAGAGGRRHTVAVAGDGRIDPDDPRLDLARALGRALIDHRYRIVCGGLGGTMAAVAEGGRSSPAHTDGDIVGVLPGLDPSAANPFVDVALPTGLGHLRNALIARADALVAVGGGAGTLSEMAMAWIFDRPVIAFRVEGWSGELADRPVDARVRFPDRADDRVHGVDTPDEAIVLLQRLLP